MVANAASVLLCDIDESNTVNGRPILFLDGVSYRRVTDGYGQVIINNSLHVVLEDLVMGKGDGGVGAVRSNTITVNHCLFDGLMSGAVDLRDCWNISVTDCLFQGRNSHLALLHCRYGVPPVIKKVTGNYFLNITPDAETGAAM